MEVNVASFGVTNLSSALRIGGLIQGYDAHKRYTRREWGNTLARIAWELWARDKPRK